MGVKEAESSNRMLISGDCQDWSGVGMAFRIGGRHGQDFIREYVNDVDGQAFLERELMGFGVDGYQ